MNFSPFPYLDPGSGSLIIQILIAALLGLGVALRASWGRIKGLFSKKKSDSEDDNLDDARD
jgi:hypothetical protein